VLSWWVQRQPHRRQVDASVLRPQNDLEWRALVCFLHSTNEMTTCSFVSVAAPSMNPVDSFSRGLSPSPSSRIAQVAGVGDDGSPAVIEHNDAVANAFQDWPGALLAPACSALTLCKVFACDSLPDDPVLRRVVRTSYRAASRSSGTPARPSRDQKRPIQRHIVHEWPCLSAGIPQ